MNPKAVHNTPDAVLLPLAERGGMRPETRVFRWREIARITLEQFGGNLDSVLTLPYAEARRALKLFPNIGEPGAEKILLLCGVASGLPLESNGLRVLIRIGYGRQQKDYGRTYRSVQDDLAPDFPTAAAPLTDAFLLLRTHGKSLCKDKEPLCSKCPVATGCDHAAQRAASFLAG
jgi:endonuclease-3